MIALKNVYLIAVVDVVPNLFCTRLFFSFSLFFMTQQVHTQPVVTTASSTTDKPNRAPRTAIGLLFTSELDADRLSVNVLGVVICWDTAVTDCEQAGVTVMVEVAMLHWLRVIVARVVRWYTVVTDCEQAEGVIGCEQAGVTVMVEVAMLHWLGMIEVTGIFVVGMAFAQ